jgi:predicted porin
LKAFKADFAREADKLGCLDADMAYLACNFDDIDVTDDFEYSRDAIAKKVQEISKAKSYLFKKDARPMTNFNPTNQSGSLDLSNATDAELKQLLANAK